MWRADNSVNIWRNLPISNPKPDLHNINAQTKLVKIHWCLLKLSSENEKRTDGRMTDGRTDRHTDVQRETIVPRHCRVAGYKKYISKSKITRHTFTWDWYTSKADNSANIFHSFWKGVYSKRKRTNSYPLFRVNTFFRCGLAKSKTKCVYFRKNRRKLCIQSG